MHLRSARTSLHRLGTLLIVTLLSIPVTLGQTPSSKQPDTSDTESTSVIQAERSGSRSSTLPGAGIRKGKELAKYGKPVDPITPSAAAFTNSTPITIIDCPNPCPPSGQPASLYPSPIMVSGETGVVQRVSITLHGLRHTFPGDIDLMLVSPSGRKTLLMSDLGGANSFSGLVVTFDDYAATPASVSNIVGQFPDGSYRPGNSGMTDLFAAPAPAGPYTYTLSAFNGDNPNGVWNLYISDDVNADGGSLSGGWTISFDVRPPAPTAGQILISEFRTRGLGNGPSGEGSADEFIELYNNTDQSITIVDAVPGADPTSPTGAGWRLAVAQGANETTFVVLSQTAGTTGPTALPPRGYFLIATQPVAPNPSGNSYTLAPYPTGVGISSSGVPNVSINPVSPAVGFMPDDGGLAFYSSSTGLPAHRMDSVGFSSMTNSDYKEGTGLSPAGGITTNSQHSWVRNLSNGKPKDTNDNAADFVLVDTTAATFNGVAATLGAPGPQRGPVASAFTVSSSPIEHNANMPATLVDPMQGSAVAPNRVRDLTPVANGANGTLKIRRRFTNNTGLPIVALRYRVVAITTLTGTPIPPGQADLRVLDSPNQTITLTDKSTVFVRALTLQTPAVQVNGGGLNSSLGEGFITTSTRLLNGESTVVEFNLGVQVPGTFRFYVNVEALTVPPQ